MNTAEHEEGMPCWLDAMVSSSEHREALVDFYSNLFGWTFDVGGPETGYYSIANLNGRNVLAIGQHESSEGRWVTYFSTSNIDLACQRISANGGMIILPAMDVMNFGKLALALDSTGAVHGLWEPKLNRGFGVMYEPNAVGWFDHVSEDQSKAAQYYQKVLGTEIGLHAEGDMLVLTRGEQWFASLSQGETSEQPPQWMPVIVVDSLDRIKAKVRQLGGTIVVEEMVVPGSAISVFQDPVVGSYMTVMKEGES
jgi:hypothetical protein